MVNGRTPILIKILFKEVITGNRYKKFLKREKMSVTWNAQNGWIAIVCITCEAANR